MLSCGMIFIPEKKLLPFRWRHVIQLIIPPELPTPKFNGSIWGLVILKDFLLHLPALWCNGQVEKSCSRSPHSGLVMVEMGVMYLL